MTCFSLMSLSEELSQLVELCEKLLSVKSSLLPVLVNCSQRLNKPKQIVEFRLLWIYICVFHILIKKRKSRNFSFIP